MNDENILSAIANLILYYIKRVGDLVHLAALEAQLALRTLIVIAILIFLSGCVLTVCWASLLTFLFFYLVSLQYSSLFASGVIVLVNIAMLLLIGFVIYRIKDNLFFPATTKQLTHQGIEELDIKHERITTEN